MTMKTFFLWHASSISENFPTYVALGGSFSIDPLVWTALDYIHTMSMLPKGALEMSLQHRKFLERDAFCPQFLGQPCHPSGLYLLDD